MTSGQDADPFREVQLIALRTLRGANFWSPDPVTRLDLAVGAFDGIPSNAISGLPDALLAALPGLIEHRCSIGERGGFLTRLRRGTYVPHIIEHLALELQNAIGHGVGYGRARGGDRDGEYTVVFAHEHNAVGRRAGALALRLAQEAFAGCPMDAGAAVEELRRVARIRDEPELRRAVDCAVIGSGDRLAVGRELQIRLDTVDVVDVAPDSVLQTGLPYRSSRTAVVLDLEPGDVAARYADRENATRMMATVADGVSRGGIVIAPAEARDLHELILDAGRRVAVFTTGDSIPSHADRISHASASIRDGAILIDRGGLLEESGRLHGDAPVDAQAAAALTAVVLGEEGTS